MYRYVAFSWNSKDAARTAAAQRLAGLLLSTSPDWQSVLDTQGLRVFHALRPGGACHAYVLTQDSGVILGKLFDRNLGEDGIPSDPTFDDRESDLVIESRGRRLVDRYWGHYVALLRAWDGKRHFVLRDPTGGLPCFLTRAAEVDVILSNMEDCVRLKLTPFSVDWNHVTAFFLHGRLVTRTTGFRDATQLLAGECVAIEDGTAATRVTRSFYWHPASVYEADTIEEPALARAALRGVIRQCTNAWASCYDSIVHQLSGGLDSSIVAACLASGTARPDVLLFHYFTEIPEGDERSYARAAAHRAGLELIERAISVSGTTLEDQLDRARTASPALLGFVPASELFLRHLVAEKHAGAVFSGQGGDHLFQQHRSKLVAAEYAHRHGIRRQLCRVVRETSRMTKQPVWSVFGTAAGYGLLRRSFDPTAAYVRETPILTVDARASVKPAAYTHPWLESTRRLPASKRQQVFNVVDCQPFYQWPCHYAEQIHPLISQPVIECSLQIPTYVLTHRGRSRGLVREAFEADVPARIIHRESKGGTTSYFNRMLVENAVFLREFLLDGVLVNEGVLDRRELEKQLSDRELIRGTELMAIVFATRAEAWLNNWAGAKQPTAA